VADVEQTSEELKIAPTVAKNDMLTSPSEVRQTVDNFFGVRTVARPSERTVRCLPAQQDRETGSCF